MPEWYSIEVLDGATSAASWADVHGDMLVESALLAGAKDWNWHNHSWGVVLELLFPDGPAWEAWHQQPGVESALDSVPDPLSGLIVYRGRGGSSGAPSPRRPRPLAGSGAAALPLPWDMGEDEAKFLPHAPRRFLVGSLSGANS